VWGPRQDIDRISFHVKGPQPRESFMICPWAGAKTLIFTNFVHTGPLWKSVGWWGLIRSIEAKNMYTKKEKILRPGLKKEKKVKLH
jgi:hypothetical protein